MGNVTVYIKNCNIVVDYSRGNLHVDSVNLAARIKRLPDVKSASIARSGNITVILSSVSNAAALQRQIADLAADLHVQPPEAPQSAQLALF